MKNFLGLTAITLATIISGTSLAAQRSVTLLVEGMTCASCPYIVKQSLARVPGVSGVTVSFEKKSAVVIFDDARADVSSLTAATASVGFPSRLVE